MVVVFRFVLRSGRDNLFSALFTYESTFQAMKSLLLPYYL